MIWVAVWLVEWRANLDEDARRADRLLGWIAAVLVAAVFTRYDGWVMALLAWTASAWCCSARPAALAHLLAGKRGGGGCADCVVCLQRRGFGDWLEFARGPYSAKAIELRTATRMAPVRRIRAGTTHGFRCCSF